MKKTFFIALFCCFLCALVGCEKKKTTSSNTASPTKTIIPSSSSTKEDPVFVIDDPLYVTSNLENINGDNDGLSVEKPLSLKDGLEMMTVGRTLYLLEGIYEIDERIVLSLDGTEEHLNYFMAYNDGNVVINTSLGIRVTGDYWHIEGIKVTGVKIYGAFHISGSFNYLYDCEAYDNITNGFLVASINESSYSTYPKENIIKNCSAYYNGDIDSGSVSASGFIVARAGNNNQFDGCISYGNPDSGFKLSPSSGSTIGITTIENCLAFKNGFNRENETYGTGNGFTLGNSDYPYSKEHIISNCISYGNTCHGFYDGCNGSLLISNCTAVDNGQKTTYGANFMLYSASGGRNKNIMTNLLSIYTGEIIRSDLFMGTSSNSIVGIYDSVLNKANYYYFSQARTAYHNDMTSLDGEIPAPILIEDLVINDIFKNTILEFESIEDLRDSLDNIYLNDFLEIKDTFTYYSFEEYGKIGATFIIETDHE